MNFESFWIKIDNRRSSAWKLQRQIREIAMNKTVGGIFVGAALLASVPTCAQEVIMPTELIGDYGPDSGDGCSQVVMRITQNGFLSMTDGAMCTLSEITVDPDEGTFRAFRCTQPQPELFELGATWTLRSDGQLVIERGGHAKLYRKCDD